MTSGRIAAVHRAFNCRRVAPCAPYLIHGSLGPMNTQTKWHLDLLIHFAEFTPHIPYTLQRTGRWYGTVNVDLYSAIITKASNALDTLVSGEKPGSDPV